MPSENFLYKPAVSRNKRFGYLYKDPKIREYQEKIKADFELTLPQELPDRHDPLYLLGYYIFGVRKSYTEKDVTNMIKATEDALFLLLPYDDSDVRFNAEQKIESEEDFCLIRLGLVFDPTASPIDKMIELMKYREGNYE